MSGCIENNTQVSTAKTGFLYVLRQVTEHEVVSLLGGMRGTISIFEPRSFKSVGTVA